jgi:hypothetical protein
MKLELTDYVNILPANKFDTFIYNIIYAFNDKTLDFEKYKKNQYDFCILRKTKIDFKKIYKIFIDSDNILCYSYKNFKYKWFLINQKFYILEPTDNILYISNDWTIWSENDKRYLVNLLFHILDCHNKLNETEIWTVFSDKNYNIKLYL